MLGIFKDEKICDMMYVSLTFYKISNEKKKKDCFVEKENNSFLLSQAGMLMDYPKINSGEQEGRFQTV